MFDFVTALDGLTAFQIILLVVTVFFFIKLVRYVVRKGKRISKKVIGGAVALGTTLPVQLGTLITSTFLG